MSTMQFIRDRAKGWLAWVIVTLIAIPFALWGIQQYFNPNPEVRVARVNGTELTLQQLQQAYVQERLRLQSVLGDNFDVNQLDQERLRRQTLEQLIEEELVLQAGRQAGLTVSDAQLVQRIHGQPVFQENGAFSEQRYQQWLQSRGYTTGGFERELRRSLLAGQVYTGVAATAIVTASELERLLELTTQKRTFSELVVPAERYRHAAIDEQAIREYYREHRSEFVTPEQVSVRYVELSRASIAESIDPTEEQLRRYYEARQANYRIPEQRRASHILLNLDEEASPEAVAAAREKLQSLKEKLEQGADFAELAREHSEDPGSAERGGDLGFFGRGTMEQAFEQAVFSMAPGEISEPVRTSFGMHLIKLTEIEQGGVRSFEEARESVARDYRRAQAEDRFFEQAERLANLAFEYPGSLGMAADSLGLEIKRSELFSREGRRQGIAGEPKVVEAAFSPDVLEDGYNSEALELDDGRVVVLRVDEHRPSSQQSLDEARERIAEMLRRERARAEAEEVGREVLAKVRAGADPVSVAVEYGLEWQRRSDIGRDSQGVPEEVRRTVFSMPKPGAGETVYDGLARASGEFVVVALHSVSDGKAEAIPVARRENIRNTLVREYGRSAYQSYVQALRDRAEVRVFEEGL